MWIVGEDVSWGFNYDLADFICVNGNKLVFYMRNSNCQYVLQFRDGAMAKVYWVRMETARQEGARKFVIEKGDLKHEKN